MAAISTTPSIALAVILALGITAQWLAWRFKLPSIFILLAFGFLVGPVTGWLDPDRIFGTLLFPLVSISVAVILFEGGLSLKFSELPKVGGVVWNLVTIGTILTWALTAAAAYLILGFSPLLAALVGAVLVVTGPTVIGPLLRQIRPIGRPASILKWEGIMIDPIGAVLAVLVLEIILTGGLGQAVPTLAAGLLKTAVVGTLIGCLGAVLITFALRYYWLPDFLHSPLTLMTVVIAFTISNRFQAESGLLAATAMGMALANQKRANVKRIAEFKEDLRVILISSLFVILAARLDLEHLSLLDQKAFIFLGVLIFVIRPAAVWLSTLGAKLTLKERFFISAVAPRGIVAAAIASVFALELARTAGGDSGEKFGCAGSRHTGSIGPGGRRPHVRAHTQ